MSNNTTTYTDDGIVRFDHSVATVTVQGLGFQQKTSGHQLSQFRGIKYGKIPGRFKRAGLFELGEGVAGSTGLVDCTEFGPVCPQNYTSPGVLVRIPERQDDPLERQDEIECLNLTITAPRQIESGKKLPVFVWIYGGSQTMTFGSPGSKLCDMRRIVADSVALAKPIIGVVLNYRLNIFAFADGSETNLALKDQALGIEWIRKYIDGFGGDGDNITLAGESAGGVYTHAHTIVGTPVKRAIYQSGNLPLSPAMPGKAGQAMVDGLAKKVQERDGCSLRDAPVDSLLRAQAENNVVSMWLQQADGLEDWQSKEEQIDELLIGDCEYESVLWRNGIESLTADEICAAFEKVSNAAEVMEAYGIVPGRPVACKLGALDFLNDLRFAIPPNDIAGKWRSEGKKVYQYIVDQPNPWQPSSRPHHAVDLILLFGGFDFSISNRKAEAVGAAMRERWISFINGEAPWDPRYRMAFGPLGNSQEIDEEEYRDRRRVAHFELLKRSVPGEIISAFAALAVGRLSLNN